MSQNRKYDECEKDTGRGFDMFILSWMYYHHIRYDIEYNRMLIMPWATDTWIWHN